MLTFQSALELEKNIKLGKTELYHILRCDPDYILEMKHLRKKFARREMKVHGVATMWQSDIAIMYDMSDFTCFLLCVDVFSRKIFCEPLKNKTAIAVQQGFKKIFKKAELIPNQLETDRGKEFLGNKLFFKKQGIFFKTKIGRHKAAFAERSIQLVKQKLYRLLRTLRSQEWPKYLQTVVDAINNLPHKAIGNLRPADIKTREDTEKIDEAVGVPEDVPFEDQKKAQKNYEANSRKLQKGDHVHADFGPQSFDRGFDTRNYQLYKILRVDAGKTPVLYKLVDLHDDEIPGYFYKEQLTKANPPGNGTFRIEKVLKSKIENGVEKSYVKYLHYPNKFNQWIPNTNFVD